MAMMKGTAKADRLLGTDTDDTIYGFDGPDTLIGSAGNDRLYGGNGVDYLYGDIVPGLPSGVGRGPGHVTVPETAGNRTVARAIDVANAFKLFQDADVAIRRSYRMSRSTNRAPAMSIITR